MLEDFAASLQHEGEIQKESPEGERTEEREKETPAVPPTDDTTKTDKPSQGGGNTPDANLPFHKHPRWIKTQEELAELRRFREESDVKISAYEQVMSKIGKTDNASAQIPDWFPKSGNQQVDEQKYKEYLSYESGVKAQIKQELLEDQTREAQTKVAEEKKWADWVNTSLDKLEDEGKKFDRNELQAIALKYLPSDTEGNIDFGKAYEIMTELKKADTNLQAQKSDARKRVGDISTTTKTGSEQAKPKFETQQSLRNRSFDQLIRETN